jgi:hypothetical protein
MTFQWNGTLRHWGSGFGYRDGQRVSELLGSTLRMKTYEFEGPDDLLSYKLTGDFIIRPEAPPQDQLDALCRVIRADRGPAIRFSQQTLQRPVIVFSGQYEFHPLEGSNSPKAVHMYVDKVDPNSGAGGGSGSLAEFLQAVGSRVGVAVADEVAGERPTMMSWNHHHSSYLSGQKPGADRDEKIRKLLEGIAQQTKLQFKIEPRPVPVWVAEHGNANEGL